MTSGLITGEVLDAAEPPRAGWNRLHGHRIRDVEAPGSRFGAPRPQEARALFTIEEHGIAGGLGTAVWKCWGAAPAVVNRIGLHDRFLESGSPRELRVKFGLTAAAIAARVREVCRDTQRPPDQQWRHGRIQ